MTTSLASVARVIVARYPYRRMAGIVGSDHDVGEGWRVVFMVVAGERRECPAICGWGASFQRVGTEQQVHGEVRAQSPAQQQRAVHQDHPVGRDLDVAGAAGSVDPRVPEAGQHLSAATGRPRTSRPGS